MLILYFKNDHLPNFFELYEIIFFLRVCFIALWEIIFISFLGGVVKLGVENILSMQRSSRVTQNKCIPIGLGEVVKKSRCRWERVPFLVWTETLASNGESSPGKTQFLTGAELGSPECFTGFFNTWSEIPLFQELEFSSTSPRLVCSQPK